FQIFQEITDVFWRAEVPLIHKVIPMLELLESGLQDVQDSDKLPNVLCIAAISALIVIGKY
ncbi:hypothetical protein B0H10DRAFT_1856353, partial [Mycena sp. CBHHK59/15]